MRLLISMPNFSTLFTWSCLQTANKGKCWLLKKSLYGLRQSGYEWNKHLTRTLLSNGFTQGKADPCLFTKGEEKAIILVFVDDLAIFTRDEKSANEIVKMLKRNYKLRDLGEIKNYLGVEIKRHEKGLKIAQRSKILKLLKQYKMEECKGAIIPMNVEFQTENVTGPDCDIEMYRSLIGSLLYLSRWSRPDISIAVNLLARNVSKPTERHWQAAKRVLRYLKETQNKELNLEPKGELRITAYADANYGNDVVTRRSTSGITVHLGGSIVNWKTARQKFISLSSAESEYAALSELCTDLIFYKQLAPDIGMDLKEPISVSEDNQAVIHMVNSPNVKN